MEISSNAFSKRLQIGGFNAIKPMIKLFFLFVCIFDTQDIHKPFFDRMSFTHFI